MHHSLILGEISLFFLYIEVYSLLRHLVMKFVILDDGSFGSFMTQKFQSHLLLLKAKRCLVQHLEGRCVRLREIYCQNMAEIFCFYVLTIMFSLF